MANLLDRAIESIAPQWGARRASARVKLATYAGAVRDRLTADRPVRQTSADSALIPDLPTLNAWCRATARDDGTGRAIVDGYRRHVVGTGITCRSVAARPDGKLNRDFNSAAQRLWKRWACDPRACDIEGRKSFIEMQGLCITEFVTVGQSFCILNVIENRLRLQWFETEQLDVLKTHDSETGNEIRHGVEIDKYSRPVAYWVYTDQHPYDYLPSSRFRLQSTRVPAERVLHFFRQDRPRETHGVSRLAAILRDQRQFKMLNEFMLIRARMEAAIGGSVETDPNFALESELPSVGAPTTLASGAKELRIEPGLILDPGPGRKVSFNTPTTPGAMYDPFSKRQLHLIAAGAGLDYATVLRDFSQGNFSSQRQAMLERDTETDSIQRHLIDTVLQPIHDLFITLAVLRGELSAVDFFRDAESQANYLATEWQPPPKKWIDPQNQANAAKIELEQRLTSIGALLNERGQNVDDVFAAIAYEQELADEYGIDLPAVQSALVENAPGAPLPAYQDTPVDQAEIDTQLEPVA